MAPGSPGSPGRPERHEQDQPQGWEICAVLSGLVGYIPIWLVVSTPLKNMKVTWDYYSQYMEKKTCSKPPTSHDWVYHVRFLGPFRDCHPNPISIIEFRDVRSQHCPDQQSPKGCCSLGTISVVKPLIWSCYFPILNRPRSSQSLVSCGVDMIFETTVFLRGPVFQGPPIFG